MICVDTLLFHVVKLIHVILSTMLKNADYKMLVVLDQNTVEYHFEFAIPYTGSKILILPNPNLQSAKLKCCYIFLQLWYKKKMPGFQYTLYYSTDTL